MIVVKELRCGECFDCKRQANGAVLRFVMGEVRELFFCHRHVGKFLRNVQESSFKRHVMFMTKQKVEDIVSFAL